MSREHPPDDGRVATASRLASGLVAVCAYALVAIGLLAAPLHSPMELLPYASSLDEPGLHRAIGLDHLDQSMVTAVVARNAATLVTRPLSLFDDSQCFPMPRGYTLGEHMAGFSLLAMVPWSWSGDPIFSFNVAFLLSLVIAGATMFVLARHFTGSVTAAFVAGLLFELAPRRIADPSHPYIQGDLWTPLALLFVHRLFARARWRDALGCAVFLSLALLESLYAVIALAIVLGIYGPYALVRHRERATVILPKLCAVVATVFLVAWLVFGPYLDTKATWGLLGGRGSVMYTASQYLPGSIAFPGFALLGLVVLGAADRLRGTRPVEGEDPRLPLLAAAALLIGCTVGHWHLPLLDVALPSPLVLAQQFVPGLDAVRALPRVGLGATLPLVVVASYGVLLLERRLSGRTAKLAVAVIVGSVLAGVFVSPVARASFGVATLAPGSWHARPSDDDVTLMRQLPPGPLLDVPFTWFGVRRLGMAEDLLRTSYSPRPTAACYNSFASPVLRQIGTLAQALPDPAASDALHALGFRVVVVEKKQFLAPQLRAFYDGIRAQGAAPRLTQIGRTDRLIAYQLTSTTPLHQDFTALVPRSTDPVPTLAVGQTGTVQFVIGNPRREVFRQPDPLVPRDLVLRWLDAGDRTVREDRARALLPLAIGGHGTGTAWVDVEAPREPGAYLLQGALAEQPGQVLLSQQIVVGGATDTSSPPDAAIANEDLDPAAAPEPE